MLLSPIPGSKTPLAARTRTRGPQRGHAGCRRRRRLPVMFQASHHDFDARPLSVLCFLHAPGIGGVERVAMRLCRAWGERAAVTILLGRVAPSDGLDPGRCRVLVPPPPALPLSPARFETLWMILWLWRLLRRERPDVLFCAGNTYAIVAVAMRLLRGRRCPPIVMKVSNSLVRPDLPRPIQPFYRRWCRLQARWIDRIVAPSPAMREEIGAALRLPPERIAAIDNPVLDERGLARLARAGATARATARPGRHFLAAGRLEPQKDFALLLDAFAAGAGARDRLMIVGAGGERARLAARIRALGLGGRVALPGARPDIAQCLASADALLLSSRYEGMPAVIVEALGAGLPVIATTCSGGVRHLLANPRAGRLVPAGDLAALADAIRRFDPAEFDPTIGPRIAAAYVPAAAGAVLLDIFRGLTVRHALLPGDET